jgi:hypothetical protein
MSKTNTERIEASPSGPSAAPARRAARATFPPPGEGRKHYTVFRKSRAANRGARFSRVAVKASGMSAPWMKAAFHTLM